MISEYLGFDSDYIILGLAGVVIILLILLIINMVQIGKLKKRYKELSKVMHPDRGGDLELMQKLAESYGILLSYMENYRFRLNEEEVDSQFPYEDYKKRFRF